MAMTVTYTTINGQIVYENRSGVESFYHSDALGSTVALTNGAGTVTDTFTYWPYGEIANHSGSSTTPFTFIGTLGYYLDSSNNFIYVRARHYRQALLKWQSVDPVWPRESSYIYSQANPVTNLDPTGLNAIVPQSHNSGLGPLRCGEPWNSAIYNYCNNCYYGPRPRPYNCVSTCSSLASQYYYKCKRWQFPSDNPIIGFEPTGPGGPIVPVRAGPGVPPRVGRPSGSLWGPSVYSPHCRPPASSECIDAGGDKETLYYDVSACKRCCAENDEDPTQCDTAFQIWYVNFKDFQEPFEMG